MTALPDNCVHLMVTSPPYNATKEYDDDLTLREYLDFLRRVFGECYRVLVDGYTHGSLSMTSYTVGLDTLTVQPFDRAAGGQRCPQVPADETNI